MNTREKKCSRVNRNLLSINFQKYITYDNYNTCNMNRYLVHSYMGTDVHVYQIEINKAN